MRYLKFVTPLLLGILCLSGCVTETVSGAFTEQDKSEENARINNPRDKLHDEKEIADLIAALQDDPEMQAILNDQAAMNAVIFMDMNFIENDPRMRKLRNNPHMRALLKRLSQ